MSSSFFDKAADAVSFVDLYMKRKNRLAEQERRRNGDAAPDRAANELEEHPILNLRNIATGLRIAGAAATLFTALSAASNRNNAENEQEDERDTRRER